MPSSSTLSSSTGALTSFQTCSSESRRPRSRSRRCTASSRTSSGPIDSTESQPSVAHWRSAAVCHARSAAGQLLPGSRSADPRAAAGSERCRRSGSRGGRREAARSGASAASISSGSAFAQTIPVSTPTWPRSTRPKRPARPAICAISHACRSRRSSPSNFCDSAKRSVSQGRLTPWPSTSVAQQTVACAVHEALDLEPARRERHRAVEHRDLPRLAAVQLAGEREHRAAAERDDDRAGLQALERDRARPVERRLALEEADLGLAETRSARAGAPRPRRAGGCAGTRRRAAAASRPSRARRRRPTAPRRARAPRRRAAPSPPCSR